LEGDDRALAVVAVTGDAVEQISSAPNPSACRPARRASSAPPMPPGKPKKFSIIDVCDA